MKKIVKGLLLGAMSLALTSPIGAQSQTGTTGSGQTTGTSGAAGTTSTGQAKGAVPAGEMSLGTVRIGRQVMADGKPLPAGTYQVRLTADEADKVVGQLPELNRWVEFVQRGQVKGREMVSIVPASEIGQVANARPPAPGQSRVEMLKGNEFLRIWINRGGNHFLIHLPTGQHS